MKTIVGIYLCIIVISIISGNTGDSNDIIEDNKVDAYIKKTSRAVNYPCQCIDGECGCCSGGILSNFNINLRNRVCANVTYYPEDFEFHVRIIFNNNVFYQRRMSGKNPPPLCATIPRITSLKMCLVFNNVYIIARNLHMCINMEGKYQENILFSHSFDCIRVGNNGFAVLKPEEGGGLGPPKPIKENITTTEEDYDSVVASEGDDIQSARRIFQIE